MTTMSAAPAYTTYMSPALFASDHLNLLRPSSAALSPASNASDSASSYFSMPPSRNSNRNGASKRKSTNSPASNKSAASFTWINGTNPDDFKDKTTMTTVRKVAMGSHLAQKHQQGKGEEKARRKSSTRTARNNSEDSRASDPTDIVVDNVEELQPVRPESRQPSTSSRRTPSPPKSVGQDESALVIVPSGRTMPTSVPHPFGQVLASAPLFELPRDNVILPFDVTRVGAFQSPVFIEVPISLGKPFDPFKTLPQVPHPAVSVEELKLHCSRAFGTRAMGVHWIPTLVKSPHAFLSTLCIASTHWDAIHSNVNESFQTIALRQEVMHLIGRVLLHPQDCVSDYNIIALTQLICSVIITGDQGMLGFHESGIEKMVNIRGGLDQLGVNGRLASTLSWVSILSATLREEKPRSMYYHLCASKVRNDYPPTMTIPESPIFCPWERTEFAGIERSPKRYLRCDDDTLALLKKMRMMIDLFLHETPKNRKNEGTLKNLHREITQFRSVSERSQTNVLTPKDWTYESVRIACVIQATAIVRRVPLSEAVKYAAATAAANQLQTHTPAPSSCAPSPSHMSPMTTFRHDSPLTTVSTSPSYITSSPNLNQNGFNPYFPANPPPSFSSASLTPSSSAENLLAFNPTYSFAPPRRISHLPPPPSATQTLLSSLRTAIDRSNLSDAWGEMAGVLLWIGLVSGAASRKKEKEDKEDTINRRWFSALAVRCSILLCFEHPEAIHSTMVRMSDVIEGLGRGAASTADAGGGMVSGNRRESTVSVRRESVMYMSSPARKDSAVRGGKRRRT